MSNCKHSRLVVLRQSAGLDISHANETNVFKSVTFHLSNQSVVRSTLWYKISKNNNVTYPVYRYRKSEGYVIVI